MPEMQPFRVSFVLGSPLCINHPWLHLDGIVAHVRHKMRLGRAFRYLPSKSVVSAPAHDRPAFVKTNGVRHASASVFCPDVPQKYETIFKRFEMEGYPGSGPRNLKLGEGHYRNYMINEVIVPCERVEFYGKGDIAFLQQILGTLTNLGNDRRIGYGHILRMDIEPMEEDLSLVAHGVAMRPIPVSALRSWSDAVYLACHPPYWDAKSVELCAPPGAEVVLA